MKTLKISVSVLLALLLALSASLCAFGAGNVVLSGNAGANVKWTLTDDGVLTVSGSGPVEDEVEYEYDDNGEIISSSKLNCISLSLLEYFDAQTASMDTAARERYRFSLVREIVIEEGVTALPEYELECFFPEKVTLPASLKNIGYGAFDASFATQVVFNGSALEYAQFTISGYEAGEQPYADRAAAVEGYIAQCVKEDQFQIDTIPLYALQEIFYIENGLSYADDDEIAYILEYHNDVLGADAGTLDELKEAALDLVNRHYGTNFTSIDDIYRIEDGEWGEEGVFTDAFQALYQAEADSVFNNGKIIRISFGDKLDNGEKAYTWLTVVAPEGSQIEKLASTSGVPFRDLYEGLCKYCHKDHSGSLWEKFVGFIHKILYFFAHLFGLK